MRERTENKENQLPNFYSIKYENEKPNCPRLCRAQKNYKNKRDK